MVLKYSYRQTWTSCPSPGQSDGPDQLGPQQWVLRVPVLPQGRQQKEAAQSLWGVGRWTLVLCSETILSLSTKDLYLWRRLLPGCLTGEKTGSVQYFFRFMFYRIYSVKKIYGINSRHRQSLSSSSGRCQCSSMLFIPETDDSRRHPSVWREEKVKQAPAVFTEFLFLCCCRFW